MKAQEDALTGPEARALYIFLYSEMLRHKDDIKHICTTLETVVSKFDIKPEEIELMRQKSLRYVIF